MSPLGEALRRLGECLDRMEVRYAIGGSVASSARGAPRSTMDVDIVAALEPAAAKELAQTLGPDWYADAERIREAVAAGQSFNLIYIPKAVKVDIFPVVDRFGWTELDRAEDMILPLFDNESTYPVTTAEDIVLAKLRWYAAGGQTSERQWRDIMDLVVWNPQMDRAYLEEWARRLDVEDLLARALVSNQT